MAKTRRNMFGSKVVGYINAKPAKVPKATKTYVKKAIKANKEKGYSDTELASVPATDTSVFIPLCNTVNDATLSGLEGHLEGTSIKMTYLEGMIDYANTGLTEHLMRSYIVYDRRPDQALPNPTLFLESLNSDSLRDWGNYDSNRFIVLYDKSFVIGGNSASTKSKAKVNHRFKIKLKVPKTHYSSTGAASSITSVVKGALYWLCLGDDVDANISVAASINCRTHYEI